MARSTTLAGKIGDGKLTGLIGNVQSAVDKVANFATATQEAIQGVLAPIVAVQNQVGSLMASAESIMSSVGSIGGVLPGLAPSVLTRGLVAQVSAFGQASDLFELGSSMGRMAKNLTTIGSAGAEVVVAGGDLMRLASATYGDASEWSTIAQANGLTDPKFAGLRRLLIPPSARGSGGVLSG
jgi:nucleoid-associated protein YgaU